MPSRRSTGRSRGLTMPGFLVLAMLLSVACSTAAAGLVIPSGASITLNGGSIRLGDTSLEIAGALQADTGQVLGIQNVAVASGGLLSATTGLIELSGDWQVLGSFNAGSGEVRFVDGMSAAWNVLGSTQFASLSLLSTVGKRFVVEPGSRQRISQLLSIAGTLAQPLQIERQPGGAVGEFDLQPAGSQSIAHVGVSNVHAVGQPLAPTLSNAGGSGNAAGWFGSIAGTPGVSAPAMIPATSPMALLLMILLVLAVVRITGSSVGNPR